MSTAYNNARHNLTLLEQDNVKLHEIVTGFRRELSELKTDARLWDGYVKDFKDQLACVQENALYWEDEYQHMVDESEGLEEELLQQAIATAQACCKVQNLEADIKNLRMNVGLSAMSAYVEKDHKINRLKHELAETKEDVAKVECEAKRWESYANNLEAETSRLRGVIISKDGRYQDLLNNNIALRTRNRSLESTVARSTCYG